MASLRALSTRRWTREEYDRLVEQGVLTRDDKVELIEGEIVPVAPHNAPPATAMLLGQEALRSAFGMGYDVRPALPLIAGDDSEPEPDLAVVRGNPRDFTHQHPSSAVLIVEIAESSLATDRGRKARLYARQGIPEYWIENLRDRILEVHRDPRTGPDVPSGAAYATRLIFREGDAISPLEAPDARIAVSDLLP